MCRVFSFMAIICASTTMASPAEEVLSQFIGEQVSQVEHAVNSCEEDGCIEAMGIRDFSFTRFMLTFSGSVAFDIEEIANISVVPEITFVFDNKI